MRLFSFTWNNDSSAGVCFVFANSREQAQELVDRRMGERCSFDEEVQVEPGTTFVVTTEQRPL